MIRLSEEREKLLSDEIKKFFRQERDEEISDFKAKIYLDFIIDNIGIYVYNQAIADANTLMQEKVDELFTLEKRLECKNNFKTTKKT